jgi:hypothetical protein
MNHRGAGIIHFKGIHFAGAFAALLIFGNRVCHGQSPANDDFANRAVLSGSSAIMEGAMAGSTREPSEPVHAGDSTHGTLWWTWTAPTDGIVEIADLPGFPVYTMAQVVAVYEGNSLDALQPITSDPSVWYQEAFFRAVAGHTYQIAVTTGVDGSYSAELSLNFYDPPSNDNFADRLPIVIGVTNDSCSFFATMEFGEPPVFYGHKTLWWTWTAPGPGLFTIWRMGNTLAQVFTGTNLDQLTDAGNGPFTVQSGDTFQIQMDEDAYPGNLSHGHEQFYTTFLAVPVNDNFSNRLVLSGLPVEVDGNNYLATSEPGEPLHMKQGPMSTVWYQWTAPRTAQVGLLLDGSWVTKIISVYTGDSLAKLSPVAGASYTPVPLMFKALAGRTYNIAVGTTLNAGAFHLSIIPAPSNDDFAASQILTGWNAESNSYTTCATIERGEQSITRFDSKQSVWWTWQAPISGLVKLEARSKFPVVLSVYTGDKVSNLSEAPVVDYFPAINLTTESFVATAGTVYRIRASGLRVVQDKQLLIENGRVDLRLTISTLQASIAGGSNTFTSPQNVTVQGQPVAEDFADAVITSFSAQRKDNTPVNATISGPPWEHIFTNLPPGIYQITTSGTNAAGTAVFSSPFTIRVKPANDDFANRVALPPAPSSAYGDFAGATLEPGEPKQSSADTASMWHAWTPTNTATFSVTMYAGTIGIYDGDSFSNLHLLKSASKGAFTFNAVSNHTYQIRGSTTANPEASDSTYFAFFAQKQPNDNFANRTMLEGTNVTFVSDDSAATVENGEPGGIQPSVWWTWTAPAEGLIMLSHTNAASQVGLGVFTGSTLKKLQAMSSVYAVSTTHLSETFIPVHSGSNYQFAVYAPYNLVAQPVAMNLRFIPQSTNDNFADRIQLNDTNLMLSGANYAATRETNEAPRSVNGVPVKATLWWEWTARTNGTVSMVFVAGGYRPFVEVFEGPSLNALTTVANNITFLGIPSSFQFAVQAGHTYFVSAGALGDGRGEFVMKFIPPAD